MKKKLVFAILLLLMLTGCKKDRKSQYFSEVIISPAAAITPDILISETGEPELSEIVSTPTFLPARSLLPHKKYAKPPANFWNCTLESDSNWLCKVFSIGEVAMDKPVESFFVEYDQAGTIISYRYVQHIYDMTNVATLESFIFRSDSIIEYSLEGENLETEKETVRSLTSSFFNSFLPTVKSLPASNRHDCNGYVLEINLDPDYFALSLYPNQDEP